MYDFIEDYMIKSGLSEALDVSIFMDKDGNEVSENDEARLGMKIFTHITHPQLCIFADEVGCNTFQKGDGHIGGAKKYVSVDVYPINK